MKINRYFDLRVFCLLYLLIYSLGAYSVNLEGFLNLQSNPRLIKVKLETDTSHQAVIGVSESGLIKDASKEVPLKGLVKYHIKLNPQGNYDLCMIKDGKDIKITDLKSPMLYKAKPGSPVFFNTRWYRGEIELADSSAGMVAVNKLDIQHLITSLIGGIVKLNDSLQSIEATSVIMRSSLFTLSITSKDDYHLNGKVIDYRGMEAEKDFVNQIIEKTDGEVLFQSNGELIYTPLKVASVEGAVPFELIGAKTKAWEKVVSLAEARRILESAGYQIGDIVSFKQESVSSPRDGFLLESGPIVKAVGKAGNAQMSMSKAQQAFNLPTTFFRVYSFVGEDGQENLQFIGSIPSYQNMPQNPVMNILRSAQQVSVLGDDCASLLQKMYPGSHLGRI
jgi:peptidoglycan hydrolase-like amidase